jgi:hypothetical protein
MPSAESEPLQTPTAPQGSPPQGGEDGLPEVPASIARWVKTECGRAKYQELASRRGPWAGLRRRWFVLIAALRDWRLPPSTLS